MVGMTQNESDKSLALSSQRETDDQDGKKAALMAQLQKLEVAAGSGIGCSSFPSAFPGPFGISESCSLYPSQL